MNKPCFICKLKEQNVVTYGEFLTKSNISVHYFCLLLSTNLPQNGKSDSSGFLRFLLTDITKLVKAIKNTKCTYCGKKYASIYCAAPRCRRVFHQICGAKQDCRYEFLGQFRAFCPDHDHIKQEPHADDQLCMICGDVLPAYRATRTVPSCCSNKSWSHIDCLRNYALKAGYYFKCFKCRNGNYNDFVRRRGVYVPDRDAEWEREPNAYKELLRRHNRCDAKHCICENGRQYTTTSGQWQIVLCNSCASFGMHVSCARSTDITLDRGRFCCNACISILNRTACLDVYDLNDTLVDDREMPILRTNFQNSVVPNDAYKTKAHQQAITEDSEPSVGPGLYENISSPRVVATVENDDSDLVSETTAAHSDTSSSIGITNSKRRREELAKQSAAQEVAATATNLIAVNRDECNEASDSDLRQVAALVSTVENDDSDLVSETTAAGHSDTSSSIGITNSKRRREELAKQSAAQEVAATATNLIASTVENDDSDLVSKTTAAGHSDTSSSIGITNSKRRREELAKQSAAQEVAATVAAFVSTIGNDESSLVSHKLVPTVVHHSVTSSNIGAGKRYRRRAASAKRPAAAALATTVIISDDDSSDVSAMVNEMCQPKRMRLKNQIVDNGSNMVVPSASGTSKSNRQRAAAAVKLPAAVSVVPIVNKNKYYADRMRMFWDKFIWNQIEKPY